ncbi:high-affinity nickel-transport protein-domain-containing protein [Xylariaceae sp. FL0804]|nr:high-affinity nickel-transport protein-domain-containing protein [Xylariaceae sp. FL0804]
MPHHPATTTNHPAAPDPAADGLRLEGAGCMATVFRRLFRIVDRPWKMYPLGVLFGLGFDTSSEIAVLGIASLQGARGTSLWVILIFPALFTAGMCLLDTTDGALMMSLYTSKAFARDRVAILYYSVVLTAVTVVASAFIGVVQILSLIQNVIAESSTENNRFWEGLGAIGDHFDLVGGCICALFLVAGVASVLAYGPWRRRVERSRMRRMMMMGRSSSDSSSRPADPAGHSALSTA